MIALFEYKNTIVDYEFDSTSLDQIKSDIELGGGKFIAVLENANFPMESFDVAKKALMTLGLAGSLAMGGEPNNIEQYMKDIPQISSAYDKQLMDWVKSDEFDPTATPDKIPGYVDAINKYNELVKLDQKAADTFARSMNNKWKMVRDFVPPIGPQTKN